LPDYNIELAEKTSLASLPSVNVNCDEHSEDEDLNQPEEFDSMMARGPHHLSDVEQEETRLSAASCTEIELSDNNEPPEVLPDRSNTGVPQSSLTLG
jgi:hypothetical protein